MMGVCEGVMAEENLVMDLNSLKIRPKYVFSVLETGELG